MIPLPSIYFMKKIIGENYLTILIYKGEEELAKKLVWRYLGSL